MGGSAPLLCLLCLVAGESCWAGLTAASPAVLGVEPGVGQPQGLGGLAQGVAQGLGGGLRWPYAGYAAYGPAALYKRLPQYNFGLGKRATSSKLYSFGLGKRAPDYDEDTSSEDELSLADDQQVLEDELDKRARGYSFGLGKRTKQYSFGLGKRAKYSFGLGKRADRGERKLYSFGLGKRLPGGERRYAFGLGKRSDSDLDEQVDVAVGEDQRPQYWQSENSIGKREVAAQDLRDVAEEQGKQDINAAAVSATGGAHSVHKRAAPMQYSFGIGKRADEDGVVDVLELEDLEQDDGGLMRGARAGGKQYGFGLGKRAPSTAYRQYGAKRGPRQYGFGLGRRSMQYNFGIGKRSSAEVASEATPGPSPPTER